MPQNKDPLARDRQASKTKGHLAAHVPPMEAVDERALKVWKLRTEDRLTPAEIAKRLKIPTYTVYRDLNDKHQLIMAAMSQYGQFRRNENERELEDFKAMCASYMYDPNVVIRGEKVDSDGKPRMVELSKFEAMVRVGQLWLSAMNMQNKMWGLYTVPEQAPQQDAPGTMVNIKNVSIAIVEELQKIARGANVPLRIEDKDEEPRPRATHNGSPTPEPGGGIAG